MAQPQIVVPRASLAWRLRARFSSKLPPREYLTPDVRRASPGWGDETFNRQISTLELFLPTGHRLLLAGMQAYNFFVEASSTFSSRGGGARLEAFWVCGRIPFRDMVDMWRIGAGKVTRHCKPWGCEWGGAPTTGWRFGDLNVKLFSGIVEGH